MFISAGVKRIQTLDFVHTGGGAAVDVAITAVVLANSIIIPLGDNLSTAGGTFSSVSLPPKFEFTSTTNVRCTPNGAGSTGTSSCLVVEFYGFFVKNHGSGSGALTDNVDNTKDVNLGATVVMAKTILVMVGMTCTAASFVMGGNLGDDTENVIKGKAELLSTTQARVSWVFNINIANHPASRVVYFNWIELR